MSAILTHYRCPDCRTIVSDRFSAHDCQPKIQVTNPYPEWQRLAGEMNCWNCYKLLWHRADTLARLCNDCQRTHVAVDVCLGCDQSPCECPAQIAKAGMNDCGQRPTKQRSEKR